MIKMELIRAHVNDVMTVYRISQTVIAAQYPKYYPAGAVDFFSSHHSSEAIAQSVESDNVFLIYSDGKLAGTVTAAGNHITRFFVLPDYQGRGLGTAAMDRLEKQLLARYGSVELDASLPAQSMYLRRGYIQTEYFKHKCENGDFLCYSVMRLDSSADINLNESMV